MLQDELIEEYDIPNVEEAVSLCQEVCQIQEGCNFFDYNKNASKCYLFSYRSQPRKLHTCYDLALNH